MGLDYKKIGEQFDKFLSEITKEELEKYFPPDTTPHGWVSVEEHLPQCLALDFCTQGYSVYKVKDKDGKEFETAVADHMTWYHLHAKPAGITHWWNENHPDEPKKNDESDKT